MATVGYWHIDIFPWMKWKASTTLTPSRVNDSTALGMGYVNGAGGGSPGVHIEWDAALTAGTWTLTVIYAKGPNSGIITPSVDGVDLSTFDAYAGSGAFNQVYQVTGISVASDGIKEVKFRADSKNASSGNYGFAAQLINFTRTA